MTIEQTIDIPADHRLMFDIPQEVPEGKAKVKLSIKPFKPFKPFKLFTKKPKKDCNGRTDGIPLGDGRIYYPALPGYTPGPPDPETAAIIKEADERFERERAAGYVPFQKSFGSLKDSPCFACRDGVEIQREMRDEWN